MFYGVFYYDIYSSYRNVYIGGYYNSIQEASERLTFLIPEHKKGYGNAIQNRLRVGWISSYEFGDINHTETSCNQPYNSVKLSIENKE